jgi:hypothetical protein
MAQAASCPVQLPEIAIIEKPADHVRRDPLGADQVKLASGRELKIPIGASQRSLKTSMEKVAGLNHDHPSGVAIEMAIGQPEELRRVRLVGHAASIGLILLYHKFLYHKFHLWLLRMRRTQCGHL